jgi:hypothetical protein
MIVPKASTIPENMVRGRGEGKQYEVQSTE